ncbi:MAG: MFS transporter [Bacillota bacterium]|nr:MFS transporter [Bacillota bacterium]
MKKLSSGKMWCFALGQLGWSMLSGIITNWLVYFYQPDLAAQKAGQTFFIPQGLVILGVATIIGVITAFGRVFDAFTDPWIASLSDRCKSKDGRRIPFLKWSSIPLALSVFFVFVSPVNKISWINGIFLFIMVLIYYLAITAYVTPFNALIPELGHTQKERLNISTTISLTFIVGTAFAYISPVIWGIMEPSLGRITAMRVTFAGLALIALIFLFVPVFTIKEKDYVEAEPAEGTALSSLVKTFRNKDFRVFVCSDISYWIALTMFQTGLPFFVTSLLKLPETMTTIFFVAMTALSLVFYIPINMLTSKFGKKKMVLFAFTGFSIAFAYTAFCGAPLGFNPTLQGFILVLLASLPMAIFGILPQAMVADVAQSDFILTNENRDGMFYAARTFSFKLGQSVSMLIFTAVATIGTASGMGYRIVAGLATILCALGGIILIFFNENHINKIINPGEVNSNE